MIFSVTQVSLNKNQCGYCGKKIPRGPLAIVPFDIVIEHKERWQYLNRNRTSELDPVYLPSSSKIPTARFYCIITKCIHSRSSLNFSRLSGIGQGLVNCVQSWELGARALPSEVYPDEKLRWHFTCTLDFRHSLWLPFVAAFAVLKGLKIHAK